MPKELEYKMHDFAADLLHKDLTNLTKCLKQQDKDNKAIVYVGRNLKVILPYEEYQKMCKRLEAIGNANFSEALECLKEISKEEVLFKDRNTIYMGGEKSNSFTHKDTIGNHFKGIEDIKQTLLKAQEQEKENVEYKMVLEIIKEKCVNIWFLMSSSTVIDYNTRIKELDDSDKFVLTKEEFDTLKEVFECIELY